MSGLNKNKSMTEEMAYIINKFPGFIQFLTALMKIKRCFKNTLTMNVVAGSAILACILITYDDAIQLRLMIFYHERLVSGVPGILPEMLRYMAVNRGL